MMPLSLHVRSYDASYKPKVEAFHPAMNLRCHSRFSTRDRLLVYLATDDIDATLATVEAHGGKTVLPKTEIPHVGWWAVFTDPTGNHLALYTSVRQG